jgi:hypothetical protein
MGRLILLIVAVILFEVSLQADGVSKLPGSKISTEDAISMSRAIFVGTVGEEGVAGPFFNVHYTSITGLQVKVVRFLRGACRSPVSLDLTAAGDEMIPKAGQTYVFFVNSIALNKLLPATDGKVAEVRKLLSKI